MKVALFAAIISVALGHSHDSIDDNGEHHHEHQDHQRLRGSTRPLSMPGQKHHFCGEPPVSEDFEPTVSHQDYYGPANSDIKESHRRKLARLGEQNYGQGGDDNECCQDGDEYGCYMDVKEAKKQGLTGPMRVTFVYDLVNQTGKELEDVGMCNELGTWKPTYCGRSSCDEIICDDEDELVTPSKLEILQDRLNWVKKYIEKTFEVRRVQDDIVANPLTFNSYQDGNGNLAPSLKTRYSNTDLVILMSMDPPAQANVAGWALCLQEDQWGRCTIGRFNWVATTLTGNAAIALAPNTITSERATALHEALHILGLKGQHERGGKLFRDERGCRQPDSFLFEDGPQSDGLADDGYITKRVRHWKTPMVLQIAREQFGCDTLRGVPMEDVRMGWLAHWEARVMGSEVMSYGLASGETYVSDITLAFFVDSGQYLANFTCGSDLSHMGSCGGGRLLEPTGEDEAIAEQSLTSSWFSGTGSNTERQEEALLLNASSVYSGGHIRWGRFQGCDFVHKKPTPSNWGERYTCEKADEYGCTPDNRMSSACLLREYGRLADNKQNAATLFPCPPSNDGSPICESRTDQGLPEEYRYFDGAQSQFGGPSEPMDYAPVRLGYWNCMDEQPELSGIIKGVEGQEVDYGQAFDALESNIPSFGGQIHSSKSRCFRSSLVAFQEINHFNPELPAYGLCYVANCYKEDYLQFGIHDAIGGGVKWYSCQGDDEKKIYIPGYVGSLNCPKVSSFCQLERITGKYYDENNPTIEWVAWIIFFAVLLILFIVFCCVRQARQHCAKCLKRSLGFEQPSKHAENIKTNCEKCVPKTLMALCIVWDLIGLGMVILGVAIMAAPAMFQDFWESASRQMYHILFVGILTAVLSSFGFAGARSKGPSLKICFYFYILICIFVTAALLAAIYFWLSGLLEVFFEAAWDKFRVQFPADMVKLTAEEATQHMHNLIMDNLVIFVPIVVFLWLSVILGIIFSGVVLTCKNITGTMAFFTSILLIGVGGVFFYYGSFMSQILSLSENLWAYSIPSLLPGVAMVAVGVMGVLHTCRCFKTRGKICIMYIHLGLAGLSFLGILSMGIFLLTQVNIIGEQINALDVNDNKFDEMMQGLSGSWDPASAKKLMMEATKTYGTLCILVTIIVLLTIITSGHGLYKTKREFKDQETERAGRRMARSTRYKAEKDHEWLQEDVEVLPKELSPNNWQPPPPNNAWQPPPQPQPNGGIEMRNMGGVPMAQPVESPFAEAVPLTPAANARFSGHNI